MYGAKVKGIIFFVIMGMCIGNAAIVCAYQNKIQGFKRHRCQDFSQYKVVSSKPADSRTFDYDSLLLVQANSDEDELFNELSQDYEEQRTAQISDPLEPYNRLMFQFNDKLYFYFLEPIAKGYGAIFPEEFRTGVENCFYNLRFPCRFVNDIFQAKFKRAAQETGSFIINTSLGLLGFLKLAEDIPALNPPPTKEDTGQTLAVWGIGQGIYVVWPILGPSSIRDSMGKVGDYFLDPITYFDPDIFSALSLGLRSGEKINYTSLRIGEYEDLKQSAFDPYSAVKDAYIQYREKQIKE